MPHGDGDGDADRGGSDCFRLAFDLSPTGIGILGPDGRYRRINRALADLIGLGRPEDLVGTMWTEVVEPSDHAAIIAQIRELLATGRTTTTSEVAFTHGTGRKVHTVLTISLVRDADDALGSTIIQVQDVTRRTLTQAALAHQATHDPLTGLPNRTLVHRRLEAALDHARGHGRVVGLLFCDVDRFKRINDSWGHDVGDQLLVEVAVRIREAVRDEDVVGRLSGDEFVVVCGDLRSREEAAALADRLRCALEIDLVVHGHRVPVSLSIGVATAVDGEDATDLLRSADTAMYEAKAQGRDRLVVFDDALRRRAKHRLELEGQLRDAVEGDGLLLHHQPIVSLPDRAVVGHEVLVRWDHPEEGLLLPGRFLDVAEESDLIVDLGRWVLRAGMRETATRRAGKVGINISARHFARPDFARDVRRAVEATGLDPQRLVLELTESLLLQADLRTVADLEGLVADGMALALDDFGTGYSSLTHLQTLPVQIVKLDRSFLVDIATDARRRALVAAVLDMGRALQVDLVAEGVETAAQADLLVDMGCAFAQGHLFGRPEPLHPSA